MTKQNSSAHFHTLVYLGAGVGLPLTACAATADRVWLIQASASQAGKLERAAAELHNVRVENALVDRESRSVTFEEYNLAWASGIETPDESLRRLYPGLRCLHSEVRQSVDIKSLVKSCLQHADAADEVGSAVLVIDLGRQAEGLLATLAESDQLARFAWIVVVPPHRRTLTLLPPHELHGPLPLPESLTWLGETARGFVAHPLLEWHRELRHEAEQLAQKLVERETNQNSLEEQLAVLLKERDSLQEQLEHQTQERALLTEQCTSVTADSEKLRLQAEELTQERDELWHKGEALGGERDELKHRVEELTAEREDALHQNHLNHVALTEEREVKTRLEAERDRLAREMEVLRQESEQQLEALVAELDGLKRQLAELNEQHKGALHQNHLNHVALTEEREAKAKLEAERDRLTRGMEDLTHEAETLRQEHRSQLRQSESLIAERDGLKRQVAELKEERGVLQQQLDERTRQRDTQAQQREALAQKNAELNKLLEERTKQRDNQNRQREEAIQERDALSEKYESLSQAQAQLTKARDQLQQRLDELSEQQEKALHQNHLNHEALGEERKLTAQLTEERDQLAQELEAARRREAQKHQQLDEEQARRQQLVEQEMLKAEAQLELVRDILTHGKDL